ncbi:hypothetical protein Pyn_29535 [Prunus yedoensis var. nudiflora]|uniref:Uncharacterized protein n=1 Tax=Prunus yedoensis var. nudiflora TaxID=2094558 RepID=A0A314UA81_PRUYE|nr:hypothetical protein Pyn_29535 [Prunus yedoensis var. nudiflora]
MEPNLDLIILALLHGSFIAGFLLLVTSVMLTALLLAFSLGLVSILINDLCYISLLFSFYFETILKHNLELGFVLIVCKLLHHAVRIILASKPFLERKISQLKAKARHVTNLIDGLRLS